MAFRFKPYFMLNRDWYFFDGETKKFKLSDLAPQEAKQSYIKFYKQNENEEVEVNEQSEAMNLFGLQGGQNNGK